MVRGESVDQLHKDAVRTEKFPDGHELEATIIENISEKPLVMIAVKVED